MRITLCGNNNDNVVGDVGVTNYHVVDDVTNYNNYQLM